MVSKLWGQNFGMVAYAIVHEFFSNTVPWSYCESIALYFSIKFEYVEESNTDPFGKRKKIEVKPIDSILFPKKNLFIFICLCYKTNRRQNRVKKSLPFIGQSPNSCSELGCARPRPRAWTSISYPTQVAATYDLSHSPLLSQVH